MLSRLRYLGKIVAPNTRYAKLYLFSNAVRCSNINKLSMQLYSKYSIPSSNSDVIDIDIDKMVAEDDEFASNFNYKPPKQIIDIRDGIVTPADVIPRITEEEEKLPDEHE